METRLNSRRTAESDARLRIWMDMLDVFHLRYFFKEVQRFKLSLQVMKCIYHTQPCLLPPS